MLQVFIMSLFSFFFFVLSACFFFLHFYIFLASILSFLLNTVFFKFKKKKKIVLWFVGFLILFAKPILKIWHLKIFCQLNCVLTLLVDSHRHVKKSETISKFSTIYFLYFWYETIYFQILTLLSLTNYNSIYTPLHAINFIKNKKI